MKNENFPAEKTKTAYHNHSDCRYVVDVGTRLRQQYPNFFASHADQWINICQTFLSADAKRDDKDWQTAVEEFTNFLEATGNSPVAKLAQTSLNESLLSLAAEQRIAGQYDAALESYAKIETDDTNTQTLIVSGRTQIYLEHIAALKKGGEAQHAEQILANLYKSQEKIDLQQVFVVSFEWAQELMKMGQYKDALRLYETIQTADENMQAQINSKRTQVYIDWIATLKKKKDEQQIEQVLANLWKSQEIDLQQAITASLEWVQEYCQAGQYEAALKLYEMFRYKKMDNRHSSKRVRNRNIRIQNEIQAQIEKVRVPLYLDWIAALKRSGEIQQAQQALTVLWDNQMVDKPYDLEVNKPYALSIGLTENDLMTALSRSTGIAAQELIRRTLLTACMGQASDSMALANSGIYQTQLSVYGNTVLHKFLSNDEYLSNVYLSSDLNAVIPGNLYYASCLKKRSQHLETCEYFNIMEGIHRTLIINQAVLDLEIREIRTGREVASTTIFGPLPVMVTSGGSKSYCPPEIGVGVGDVKDGKLSEL